MMILGINAGHSDTSTLVRNISYCFTAAKLLPFPYDTFPHMNLFQGTHYIEAVKPRQILLVFCICYIILI